MKLFGTIADIDSLKSELPTLMSFIPSKTVNICNRAEKPIAIKKPTVTYRLNLSMNFSLPTHPSRQSTSHSLISPSPRKEKGRRREVLYD